MNQPMHMVTVDLTDWWSLNQIHNVVSTHTGLWWHQLHNVWIVGGGTAEFWRDLITPYAGTATILVVTLPGGMFAIRQWALRGINAPALSDWLFKVYSAL